MGTPWAGDVARSFVAHRVPGLAAARIQPGEVRIVTAGDAGTGEPLRPHHGLAWFSITKLLTTTAVLQRIAEGTWSLHTPVATILPEHAAPPHPTIEDLLRHRAGLPDPIPWGWLRRADEPAPDPVAFRQQWLHRWAPRWWSTGRRPLDAGHRYSNLSFLTLGALLAADGRVPDALAPVLKRLGLDRTGFTPAEHPTPAAGHTRAGSLFDVAMWMAGARRASHRRWGTWRQLSPIRMEATAAGGAFGPIHDAAAFAHAWLTGEGLPFDDALRRLALTGERDYGLGFRRLGPDWGHSGSGLGFVSRLHLRPRQGSALVVFVNRSGAWGPNWEGLDELTCRLFDARWPSAAAAIQ